MSRLAIAALRHSRCGTDFWDGTLALADVIIWMAFVTGTDTSLSDLFISLGTEIFGIVVTVAVVESFWERRRLQTRGRQVAWDVLDAAEAAVWAWQGGPRELETDELLGVLNAVGGEDPLPDFTEGLFLNLAREAGACSTTTLRRWLRLRGSWERWSTSLA